jgi:predicted nicotinamide N-methyase
MALCFGALAVQLWTVRGLEDYVDSEALLRDPDAPEPPYWAHLWPGSRALARLLAAEIDCRDRSVLEVGCGLGLTGVVAALRGARVEMFDRDAAAVAFARANAELNDCAVQVRQADLLDSPALGRFDFICAADVTYEPQLQEALARLAAVSLNAGGRLLACESVRTFDRGLEQACLSHGMRFGQRDLFEDDEGRRVTVRLSEAICLSGAR